jgi:tetratricopeptide (TPR) repeat protein
MMARRLASAWLIACVALAACAPNRPEAYVSALAEGDRAISAGRRRDAARAYDEASHATGRPVDRDEAMYRAAMAFAAVGDVAAALERLDWIAAHGDAEMRGDRAAFEAARLRLANGESERAIRDIEALAIRSPDAGSVRRGVDLALSRIDRDDPSGDRGLAWIESMEPRVRGHDLEVTLRWLIARRHETAGRNELAERAYVRLLDIPYPRNTHWDDGGLAYARLLRTEGKFRDALLVIERVLASREIAILRPGSDERPRFQDLGLLRARILRDDLHENAAAAEAFHRFYVEFPDSIFRDDSLWNEIEIRESLGDHDTACALAAQLAHEFECTRFGRRGIERARACGRRVDDPDEARCHPHRHREP